MSRTALSQVVVAMSGGVDSSVAAALLQEEGHRVIGVTLRLLGGETAFGCCGSTRDIEDAKAVCARLGIPHYVLDFSDVFEEQVRDPFVRSYLKGETPNPCIDCNRYVKFDALFERALRLGADRVATGHYARIALVKKKAGAIYELRRAVDLKKDQSYVLHHLGQKQLARLLFPVGELSKAEVRGEARRLKLRVADKPDSQEICFVPNADTAAYLRRCASDSERLRPGEIRDTAGRLLGNHRGVALYTRGQRHGLGLAAGKPMYVVDLRPESNTLVVGTDEETLSPRFSVRDLHWTADSAPGRSFRAKVQIRSRHTAMACRVTVSAETGEVELNEPQRAVTPGQSAVFYAGDKVIGGGTISSAVLSSAD
ncbi:MAG TPA: tRNA 2-thiouridine(34) synthase MnmA [Elusimicrobiota bacterium]|nr:tRNA 2-thiouridine(34) synthase MnmA [Elusimicrobiota bacterium]